MGQNLSREIVQDSSWLLKRGIYCLAKLCETEGITAAEAERQLQHWAEVELFSIPWENLIQPYSIAGRDRKLQYVLSSRKQQRSLNGKTSNYGQDLLIVLWELSRGKYLEEAFNVFSKQAGTLEEQVALIVHMCQGKEQKLIRAALMIAMRKAIEGLSDIQQDLQAQKRKIKEYPSEVIKSIVSKPNIGLEPASATELLVEIGLNSRDISPSDWFILMRLSQAILEGSLDPGSKKGFSLTAVFGVEAPKIRQTISRLRKQMHHLPG